MAKKLAGQRPGEFGGLPGMYGNVDAELVSKHAGEDVKPDVLAPHQEAMSARQTPHRGDAAPAYGDGGKRVQ